MNFSLSSLSLGSLSGGSQRAPTAPEPYRLPSRVVISTPEEIDQFDGATPFEHVDYLRDSPPPVAKTGFGEHPEFG